MRFIPSSRKRDGSRLLKIMGCEYIGISKECVSFVCRELLEYKVFNIKTKIVYTVQYQI